MQYKNEKTLQLIQEFGKTLKEKRETLSKKSQTLFAYEYELDSGNISELRTGKLTLS